ncbi:hypothetical protein PoMZ_05026 [Pyricularia oryzae]|uniref:Uncharacterized protein n=1 Tax=Pyricularia oryzae TaxID=318829 RepID=A0A4P7NDJ9_PYROR|nr:hypothetical protein PoMZ_05026 [Pyricularia oryzae]
MKAYPRSQPSFIGQFLPSPPEEIWASDGFICRGTRFGPKDDSTTYDEHVTWPEDLVSANKDPFRNFWGPIIDSPKSKVYQISLAGIENRALDIDEAYRKDGKQHPRSNEGEIAMKDKIPWSNVQG